MKCIDVCWLLADYKAGKLNDIQRREVERHLESCPQCRADADLAGELESAMNPSVPAMPALSLPRPRRRLPRWTAVVASILVALVLVNVVLYQLGFALYGEVMERWKSFAEQLGFSSVLNNGLGEWPELSVKHGGITMTVDGILADESQTMVLFSVAVDEDLLETNKSVEMNHLLFFKELRMEGESGTIALDISDPNVVKGVGSGESEEFWTGAIIIQEQLKGPFTLLAEFQSIIYSDDPDSRFHQATPLPGVWEFDLSVDSGLGEPCRYSTQKPSISTAGADIEISDIMVYPTQTIIDVNVDMPAGWDVMEDGFETMMLTDGTGVEYPMQWSSKDGNTFRFGFSSLWDERPNRVALKADGLGIILEAENWITLDIGVSGQEFDIFDTIFHFEKVELDSEGVLTMTQSLDVPRKQRSVHYFYHDFRDDKGNMPNFVSCDSGNLNSLKKHWEVKYFSPGAKTVSFRVDTHNFTRGESWQLEFELEE